MNKITNISNVIEVASYTNEKQRKKEEKYQEIQKKSSEGIVSLTEDEMKILETGIDVFIDTDTLSIPYDEGMTIEKAYEYLKTTKNMKMLKIAKSREKSGLRQSFLSHFFIIQHMISLERKVVIISNKATFFRIVITFCCIAIFLFSTYLS